MLPSPRVIGFASESCTLRVTSCRIPICLKDVRVVLLLPGQDLFGVKARSTPIRGVVHPQPGPHIGKFERKPFCAGTSTISCTFGFTNVQ